MSETVSVSVSGAAFSLLFYENIKSEHDQDGFLLGSFISKETNKLTDADHRVVNRERIIKVNSVVPCPQQFYFYNSSGKIDIDKIRNFLGNEDGSVVGWYIFKRKRTSTASKLTLREKIIHKQLAESFRIPSTYFSCCLLNSDSSNIKSTYSFCQTFVRYSTAKYESLPLHITNLSDPSYTFKSAEPTTDVLNNIIKSVKSSRETEGHLIIRKVQDGLQEYMKKFLIKSAEKEQQLFKLEQEVKQLKYKLNMKREYGVDENITDASEIAVTENGTPENEFSDSTHTSLIEKSPEASRKKRVRPRRQPNCSQNSAVSPEKSSDIPGDSSNDNEEAVQRASRRLKNNNISYAEMAQKKKN